MASASKPTGVHYALVFFVLLSIVCGLGWLLAYKGSGSIGELRTQAVNANKKASDADNALKTKIEEIDRIKKTLGSSFPEVGDETNATTVVGDMVLHIKNYGMGLTSPTYNDLIVKLAEAYRST